jgi:fibronectin-binding autotransporter adhesin
MKTRSLTSLLTIPVAVLALASATHAADKIWSNAGTTDFNQTTNWTGGLPGTGDAALFDAASPSVQPATTAPITIQQIRFTTNGWTLSGGSAITLTSIGTTTNAGTGSALVLFNTIGSNTISAPLILGSAAATTARFTQTAGGTLNISGDISSANAISGLTLAGGSGSVFTLSGSNTYSGTTTLLNSGSTLNINSASAISSGALALSANQTIDNTSGAAITLANNNNINLSGGSLTFAGTQSLSFGSGTVTISVTNRTITTTAGALTIGSIDADTTARTLTKAGAGTLVVTGAAGTNFQGGVILTNGTLSISSDSNLNGTNAPLTFGGGTLQITGTNLTSLNTGRTTTFTAARTAGFDIANAANTFTVSQNLTNTTGGLLKAGAGTLSLTGTGSTYTGTTTVAEGTLALGSGVSLGNLGNSDISLGGANASANSTATLTINPTATVSLDATVTYAANAGSDNLGATIAGGTISLNSTARVFSVANSAGAVDLAVSSTLANGSISNSAVFKQGMGTMRLSGTNTYNGSTTIQGGTLLAGGNVADSTDGAFGNNITAINLGRLNFTVAGENVALLTDGAFTISRGVTVATGLSGTTDFTSTLGGNTDNTSTFSGQIIAQKDLVISQVATTGTNALQITGGITSTTNTAKTIIFAGPGAINVSGAAITNGSGGGTTAVTVTGGTTTFANTNTYTGNTAVNGGTLTLATNGSLRFAIGGSGTNNAIVGTGTTVLNGRFAFDLSSASTNTGATWTIVANTLTNSYGTNFLVTGFNGVTGGNWTNTTNGVNYVFAQSSGVLSVQSTGAFTPYNAWVAYWQGINPGFTNTAGTANPDGDPFDNNEEFAFDGNPTIGSPALLTAVKVGTNTVFNYVAMTNTNAVTYQVQNTTNLSAGPWTNSTVTISNSTNQSGISQTNNYVRKEFVVPGTNRNFYRVQASIAP